MTTPHKILAVGTVALDSIETPAGKRNRCFGGSASYFSYAASFFSKTKILAVVGEDFPPDFLECLSNRGIDTSCIEIKVGHKTFYWEGRYEGAMNAAETLKTELNVLLAFQPKLAAEDNHPILFLANIDPEIQWQLLQKKKEGQFVIIDTMNFWIQSKKQALLKVLQAADTFILNEAEARLLTGISNLIYAGEALQKMGPSVVIIKKGEHGALLFHNADFFALPAYPIREVLDPTGAGDSFAGGMVGYLAQKENFDFPAFKEALVWGTVTASFTVQGFSLERLQVLTEEDLQHRFHSFLQMVHLPFARIS